MKEDLKILRKFSHYNQRQRPWWGHLWLPGRARQWWTVSLWMICHIRVKHSLHFKLYLNNCEEEISAFQFGLRNRMTTTSKMTANVLPIGVWKNIRFIIIKKTRQQSRICLNCAYLHSNWHFLNTLPVYNILPKSERLWKTRRLLDL